MEYSVKLNRELYFKKFGEIAMVDFIEIIYSIFPFIIGLISLTMIPSKEKILKKEIKEFRAEIHIAVYILAFVPLVMGFYYSMSFFGENVENHAGDLLNAVFMEIVALGVMGINYRNYSLYSEPEHESGLAGRVEVAEVQPHQIEPISPRGHSMASQITQDTAKSIGKIQSSSIDRVEYQSVGCPRCGTAIKVRKSSGPVKISCPKCGIEGMVQ
jgi:hypothetical protein